MAADDRNEANLPRPARWEIVGAWLHIWTPPRGTYVPPVPVWRLLAAAVVTAAAITALVIVIAGWKEHGEQNERRVAAAAEARQLERLERDQSPHRALLSVEAAARASSSDAELRSAVVGQLEEAITADAQARNRAGTFDALVERTDCKPFVRPFRAHPPEPSVRSRDAGYECTAVTSDIKANVYTRAGRLGYPFWARLDFVTGEAVWCKINPRGGERGIGGDLYVALSPECDLDGKAS